MASFRKRSGKWQARVHRIGTPNLCKTFERKVDAQLWARKVERELDTGCLGTKQAYERLTLESLIQRYELEVLPRLRGKHTEIFRLNTIRRHLGKWAIGELTPQSIAQFRDQRLAEVSPSTCLREIQTLSAMLGVAAAEWGLIPDNPVKKIRKPQANQPRARRLSSEEEFRLLEAITPSKYSTNTAGRPYCRNIWLRPLVILALETAMRRGELLSLKWENINLLNKTVFLPITKNGNSRSVPLSEKAVTVLKDLPRSQDNRVFPLTPNALRQAWNRARVRAGLIDLHLHDLRHEATTRLSKRLQILELAAVTGHRDLRMLQRYTHINAEEIVSKLT